MADLPHVVILGAGFGGIGAAHKLRDAKVHLSIVDKNDFHTFQPLLYQVATDELAPSQVGHPVRELLHGHQNISFHCGEVQRVDIEKKQVYVHGMEPLTYDYLVVGLGAVVNFHGVTGAAEHSFPLYTMRDAMRLHDHILNMFEAVDRNLAAADDGTLTFCIVGGGPTGTEMAGALSELVCAELKEDYPQLPLDKVKVVLYEHSPNLLAAFSPKLRDYAREELIARNVEVHTNTGVKSVASDQITLANGGVVKTKTLVWAAGLAANSVAKSLGVPLAGGGRIPVEANLQVVGCPSVFAVGDIALARDLKTGQPLPGLGAVALQAGKYVGSSIAKLIEGEPTEPFHYVNKGTMAQVGRGAAVVDLPFGGTLTGHTAWLAWLGVHLSLLSGAEERTSVFVDWGWNLLTNKRGKRIILGDEAT